MYKNKQQKEKNAHKMFFKSFRWPKYQLNSNIKIYNKARTYEPQIIHKTTTNTNDTLQWPQLWRGKKYYHFKYSFKHQTKTLYLSVYLPHDIIAYENKQTKSLRLCQ